MSRSFGVDMARGQCTAAVESRRQGCSWPRPPIITIDDDSKTSEIACQLVLLAYWRKYLGPQEPLLDAL